MIFASCQPRLFPYAGFWDRYDRCDVFNLTFDVQLDYKGYQRRVPLGDGWLSVPVDKRDKMALIEDVRLAQSFDSQKLVNMIVGRLRTPNHPHFDRLLPMLQQLKEMQPRSLFHLLFATLDWTRTELGLPNKFTGSRAPYEGETKHDRFFERLNRISPYAGTDRHVLVGTGTASYLDKDRIPDPWSVHVHTSDQEHDDAGQSILHFIAKYDDPLTEIRSRFRVDKLDS